MSDVETELDLDMTVRRIERIMGEMPFGGTYFRHRVRPTTLSTASKPSPQERLERIENNLADLRDGLKQHCVYFNELERERGEMVADLDRLNRLIRKAMGL